MGQLVCVQHQVSHSHYFMRYWLLVVAWNFFYNYGSIWWLNKDMMVKPFYCLPHLINVVIFELCSQSPYMVGWGCSPLQPPSCRRGQNGAVQKGHKKLPVSFSFFKLKAVIGSFEEKGRNIAFKVNEEKTFGAGSAEWLKVSWRKIVFLKQFDWLYEFFTPSCAFVAAQLIFLHTSTPAILFCQVLSFYTTTFYIKK